MKTKTTKIHVWRWRALTIWIIIFTVVAILAIRQNRSYIHKLNDSKANIGALQQTNCGLKKFLLTARKVRLDAAAGEHGTQRKLDLQAARNYIALVKPFRGRAVDGCKIPASLRIKLTDADH